MTKKGKIIIFIGFLALKLLLSIEYSKTSLCKNPEGARGTITNFSGDSFSYTPAIDNYIEQGEYYFYNGSRKVYAGRMPHYSIPYYVFRQFLSKGSALDALILLQILSETIAYFLVSLLIFKLTARKLLFYLSLLFSLLSYFYTYLSIADVPDSLASSLLLIAFWFLYLFLEKALSTKKDWFLFSLFLCLAVTLRPYLVIVYPLVLLVLFFKTGKNFKYTLKKSWVFPALLSLFLLPWGIRNYNVIGKFVFLQEDMQAGYDYTKEEFMKWKVLSAIGEDGMVFWDPTTAAGYLSNRGTDYANNSRWKVPNAIKNDSVLSFNLEKLRILSKDSIDNAFQIDLFKWHSNTFLDRYKQTNKFDFYFLNYLKKVKLFLIHSGSYYFSYLPESGCDTRIKFYLKILQSLMYYLVLIFGSVGLVVLWKKNIDNSIFLFSSLCLVLFFPVYLGAVQWRYFLPFFYFHQIGLFYFLNVIIENVKPIFFKN